MKNTSLPRLLACLATLIFGAHATAFDWEAARSDLGTVDAKDTTAKSVEKGAETATWKEIPSFMTESKPLLLTQNDKHAGVVEYNVTKPGWVFFAGYFGFDGSGGEWQNERWDEPRLKQEGWTELSISETGGPLIQGDGRLWKIFARRLPAGEKAKIRLNKYQGPRFFSFSNPLPANIATVIASTPVKPGLTAASSSPSYPRPASAPPASSTTTAPSIPTAPAPTGSPFNASDLVKIHRSNLVFVTTADGAGSGFIANYGNGTYLITNAHVTAGAKGAMFKSLDGTQVQAGAPAIAAAHDIFLMALKQGGSPLQVMIGVDQNAAINDEVVVLGNAEGAGVINTIKGKIVGLGPNLVEVDAPFQPGNSGSPIIHLKTGKVIGVATYLTIRKYDSATREAVKAPIVRRFGYRLDSVKKWEAVNWQAFYAQAAEMENIEKLTKDLVNFLRDLGKDGNVNRGAHSNPAIKTRIDQWIDAQSRRLSARDSSMADQNFLSFLKVTCQSDITAGQQRLTYDYFRRQLDDQQKERTEIANFFGKIIESLRQER